MNKTGLVIAIDGPSGAGKSTIARLLSKRLGYLQIDTGAMYRAAALLISRNGINTDDSTVLTAFCNKLDIRLENISQQQHVFANGEDVSALIRTPEISLITSRIAALAPVRSALVASQREMGKNGAVVLEGRDIGTVVFPNADLKFFLSASAEERGRRRHAELIEKGENVTLEETVREVIQRDNQDSKREISPLRQAEDAIAIDSSSKGIEEVLEIMETFVKDKITAQQDSNI